MNLIEQLVDELVKEAPIRDLEPVGRGLDKPGSFDKRDRKMLSNPKAIQKIRKQWEKTPFVFDIYLVNVAALNKQEYKEIGPISPGDRYWDDVEEALGGKIPQSEDAITILFNGNQGDAKVPLTGWTMAHRLGHAARSTPAWQGFIKECSFFLRDTTKTLYDLEIAMGDDGLSHSYNMDHGKMYALIANQIGSMKSARDNQIKRYYEFFYELFAQYLITGKVTFKHFPKRLAIAQAEFGRKKYSKSADEDTLEYYNDMLDSYEYNIEQRAANVLHGLVGKVLLM